MIALLDMSVVDRKLSWELFEIDGSNRDRVLGDTNVALVLNRRRKQTLKMLADLLRHAEDGRRRDALSADLYLDLLRVVGHELFDLIFWGDGIRSAVAETLANLRDRKVDLFRITISFKGDDENFLSSLPWEYVRTPEGDDTLDGGRFLAERAELVLSRRLKVQRPRRLRYVPWPIPVLLVASSPLSNPTDKKAERLDPVDAAPIVEKLTDLQDKGHVELHTLIEEPPRHPSNYEWRVTREEVEAEIERTDPVIVHFLGHGRNFGGAGHLAFARDDGTVDWVPDEVFATYVAKSPRFNLAFLQACESALPDPYVSFSGVARHLAREGLPAVVAMQYQVRSSTANLFAGAFYDGLLVDRLRIDHAVEKGRARILASLDENTRMGFGLPVVYLNSDRGLADPDALPPNPHRTPPLQRNDLVAITLCPRCGRDLVSEDKVCRDCGLRVRCANCQHAFPEPESDKFCPECGERLDQTPFDDDVIKRAAGGITGEDAKPARATLRAIQGTEGL